MRVAVVVAFAALARPAISAAQDPPDPPAGAPPSEPAALAEDVVAAVHVEGLQRFPEAEILAALGVRVGEPYDPVLLNEGLHRVFETYHLLAAVDVRPYLPAGAPPGASPQGVEVRITVQEIPVDLEPRFVGNVEIDTETIHEWAGIEPGSDLSLDRVDRVRRNLVESYLGEGFYFVEVGAIERSGGEGVVPDVIFEILEGPRVHVRKVVLHGNESLPNRGFGPWKTGLSKLAGVVLKAPWLGLLFKKELVEEDLQADLFAMREVYRERGWLDAVVELDRFEFSDDRGWVTIHVTIDEGERYRVAALGMEAVDRTDDPDRAGEFLERPVPLVFDEAELLALCELRPGEMYSEIVQRQDQRELALYFGDHGYIAHDTLPPGVRWEFLEPLLLFDYEKHEVEVTYRIAQGQRLRIRDIRFEGTEHTRDRVVRRLLTVFPGEVANLREIQRSLSRLRGTGFFDDQLNADTHPPPRFRFDTTDEDGLVDLTYVVEEGQILDFNLQGGAGSNFGLFGEASLRLRNFDIANWPSSPGDALGEIGRKEAFHGAGQDFHLIVAPGTQLSRFKLRFSEPDIFQRHIDRISFTFDIEKRFRLFSSHDEERLESSIRLGRQITPDASVFVGIGAGKVELDDIDTGGEPSLSDPLAVPLLLAEQEGSHDLGWLELGLNWRLLDNPLDPKDGHSLGAVTQIYHGALGSDFEFVKGVVRGDLYRPLGVGRSGVPSSLALGLDLGVAVGFSDTEDVPYSERLFIGGTGGPRGFDFRGVGPNENGFAIGGETMLNGKIEYRVPLITTAYAGTIEPVEAVRGVLFLDAGVLDPEAFRLDASELRASVGFGVGLTIPLPITIAFGFPIREGDGDERELISFSIGF